MDLRAPRWIGFFVPLAFVVFPAGEAHAQRIPEGIVWSAGASLFAPFVAIPVKVGLSRILGLAPGNARLWAISAIEWVLWFPAAFLLFRSGNQSSFPLIVVLLFVSVAWIHKVRVADATWRSAFLFALPTPLLALALPFLAFALGAFFWSLKT